jgi:MFS family permease
MNATSVATASASPGSRLTTAALTLAYLGGEYSVLTMPFVLAGLMQSFQLTEATAGRLISLQLLGMAAGSALVTWSLRPGRSVRPILALSVIVIAVANVASALVHVPFVAAAGRALTGLGEGAILSAAAAAVCATPNPHRVFSIIGFAVAVVAIVSLMITPVLTAQVGSPGVFWLIALAPLLLFVLLSRVPVVGESTAAPAASTPRGVLIGAMPLLFAYFLLWIGISGQWVYAERIGNDQGLTQTQIGFWLSVGQLAGLAGPIAAAWVGPRVGLRASVVAGCLGMALSIVFFVFGGRPWTYGIGGALASFWLTFLAPCFRSRMAAFDPSGRTVALSTAVYTVGFAAAPLVVSTISTEGGGYAATGLLCVTCYVASAVISALRR